MSIAFTETERAILCIVQDQLPDSLTPYADIAQATGTDEARVLQLLRTLKANGTIRRFGASIKHQRAGWAYNAMVVWCIAENLVDEAGSYAARHPRISHCYYRPTTVPDWPYTLYTMIHGQNEGDCQQVIEQLRRETALDEYAVLESLAELKKTSMTYFPLEGATS